jgi:hypothetical protein
VFSLGRLQPADDAMFAVNDILAADLEVAAAGNSAGTENVEIFSRRVPVILIHRAVGPANVGSLKRLALFGPTFSVFKSKKIA